MTDPIVLVEVFDEEGIMRDSRTFYTLEDAREWAEGLGDATYRILTPKRLDKGYEIE